MLSGTLFRRLHFRSLDMHERINRKAYRSLKYKERKLFPKLKYINEYTSAKGPDNDNFEPDENHYYNPKIRVGNALVEIESNYNQLVSNLKLDYSSAQAAINAGYLSHYAVDALTPAHHIGSFRDKRWYDPYYRVFSLKNTHIWFELNTALYYLSNRMPRVKKEFKMINSTKIRHYFDDQIRKIRELKVYEKYITHGWNSRIKESVHKKIIPVMVKSVADVWRSSIQEAFKPKPVIHKSNIYK